MLRSRIIISTVTVDSTVKKTRITKSQIFRILKETEAGIPLTVLF